MINVLVTGSKGQLGKSLKNNIECNNAVNYIFTDKEQLDICNPKAVDDFLNGKNIKYLVNCAAYTDVDKAESNPVDTHKLNTEATGTLATACKNYNIRLIHISTDYVFNGKNYRPYTEIDKAKPTSIYGITKLKGEKVAFKNCNQTMVIRTSWLYSEYGNNFLKTILRLSSEREEIGVVSDQIGTPCYAGDLAESIHSLILKTKDNKSFESELFHFSNLGVCSWYDFAKAICSEAKVECNIKSITTADFPRPAPRPFYSVLCKNRIITKFAITIPYWRDSLVKCINNLSDSNN